MSETRTHFRMMACLYSSLRTLFGHRSDIALAANTPLHYAESHAELHKIPDLMVIKGGRSNGERAALHSWEEHSVPAVVFEITSAATWLEDLVNKSALYMRLGVKEYFIFDPHGAVLKEGVQGLRLHNGEYLPITPNKEGTLASTELGVHLVRQGDLLRLIDPESKQIIPWGEEVAGFTASASPEVDTTALQAALQRAEEAALRAEERAARAEEKATHVDQDSQRFRNLEAENAHLRVLLGQMQGTKVVR